MGTPDFYRTVSKVLGALQAGASPKVEMNSDLAWIKAYYVKDLVRIDLTMYQDPKPGRTEYTLSTDLLEPGFINSTIRLIHDGKVDRVEKKLDSWQIKGYRVVENLIRYDLLPIK